jgi:hypothetical protein
MGLRYVPPIYRIPKFDANQIFQQVMGQLTQEQIDMVDKYEADQSKSKRRPLPRSYGTILYHYALGLEIRNESNGFKLTQEIDDRAQEILDSLQKQVTSQMRWDELTENPFPDNNGKLFHPGEFPKSTPMELVVEQITQEIREYSDQFPKSNVFASFAPMTPQYIMIQSKTGRSLPQDQREVYKIGCQKLISKILGKNNQTQLNLLIWTQDFKNGVIDEKQLFKVGFTI